MTRDQLVDRLQSLLNQPDARKYGLELFEDGIRHEDDWWYVPLSANEPDINAFDYAPVLHQIEEDFEKNGTKLLLVPAMND